MIKAKKKASKKPLTLRQVLDVIDVVLAEQNTVSKNLWNVLTALRGPDDDAQYKRKRTGTAPIRCAAFPKSAKKADQDCGYVNSADFTRAGFVSFSIETGFPGHFESHLERAARALCLGQE